MRGTQRRRKRRQFPSRDFDQNRWRAWSISNRLKNAKCEPPFLRRQGAVEMLPPVMADLTRLLTATIERVENFHKAKELEVHCCAERGAGGSRILTRCVTEIGRGVAYGNWKPC